MSARHATLLGAATVALASATPALAQPEMPYEYAYPQPPGEVIFREDPVVQPVPAPPPPPEEVYEPRYEPIETVRTEEYDYEYERRRDADPHYADAPLQPPSDYRDGPPPHLRNFDRRAWMDDCRARYGGAARGSGDGAVAGGAIGAVAGGVIGNRVADGDRLAGTLIGAGVGGLAGAAVGSAVDSANERDRVDDYCEALLARHQGGYDHAKGYGEYPYGHDYPNQPPYLPAYPAPQIGYGYGYPGACGCGVTYMPVMIAIPQRAVVREYVTEEWVETRKAAHPAPTKRRAILAPRSDKRIKYSKGR